MFTIQQYRSKAAEYTELAKTAHSPAELREFQALERRFTTLADNDQWLADNHQRTVHARTEGDVVDEVTLATDE